MKLKKSFRAKAAPEVLKDAQNCGGNLCVVVKFQKNKPSTAQKKVSPATRARTLRKMVERTTQRAQSIIAESRKKDLTVNVRSSFLMNGLVVNASVETIQKLADLEEVVSIEKNRRASIPVPRPTKRSREP